jgi:dinuclear metal center YbgI/SA1388 family protein
MQISDIVGHLESLAPPAYQEPYDNAGLLTGSGTWECTGVLTTLDVTEEVVREAVARQCNLIVAHHPIVFSGLKKITGKNYVERTVIAAIKKDIAIYAIHTNLDNMVEEGVNGRIADKLGLEGRQVLLARESTLQKLYCFVPVDHLEAVRSAIFAAGAGHIGGYSECSYSVEGFGTFKGGEGGAAICRPTRRPACRKGGPFGSHPAGPSQPVGVQAMTAAHPYEEVAYDLVPLANTHSGVGAGLVGELPAEMEEKVFLGMLCEKFGLSVVRHTQLTGQPVKRVAICGGAGSFLISNALASGANIYITSDVKYHEFFDANDRLVIADIGHFESEQFTTDLLFDNLREKFRNFAVLKSDVKTNPVHYYTGAMESGPAEGRL